MMFPVRLSGTKIDYNKVTNRRGSLFAQFYLTEMKMEHMAVQYLNDNQKIVAKIKNLDTILLDFDGTIVDYFDNEATALGEVLKGQNIPETQFNDIILSYRKINDELWKQYEKKILKVEEVKVKRFASLSKEFGIPLDPVDFNREYIENFGMHVVAYPEVISAIKKFRKAHPEIKLIILTNGTDEIQHVRASNVGVKELVDGIVSSDLAGIAKPSPEIFEFAKKKYKFDFKSTLMVGDSLSSDVQGAINVDMFNCYLPPNESDIDKIDLIPQPDMVARNCVVLLEHISAVKNNM